MVPKTPPQAGTAPEIGGILLFALCAECSGYNTSREERSSRLAVVYVGAGEGEQGAFGFVYCLDANSGAVIWLFCTNQFEANVDNDPNVVPATALIGGTIQAGCHGFS
jgi:outer membrane protein assembly factor BamB